MRGPCIAGVAIILFLASGFATQTSANWAKRAREAMEAMRASETTFADIIARVTDRNTTTKAIQKIDNQLEFQMELKGDQAEVTIWKHMKVSDPKKETYLFTLSEVIRQEHARLQFQGELNNLITRCAESEQRFRISQYKKHPVRAGMPYNEAKELLKDEFKPDGVSRAAMGAYRLESDSHSIVFRQGLLVDIIPKETSNKPDADDVGKTAPEE